MASIIYPLVVNLTWSGLWKGESWGWLAKKGFLDFAGSTVVHSTGGWVALALVIIIGPRIGRFDKEGNPREISGSNLPFSILGVFALWVGWIGFNGGSTMGLTDSIGPIILNTILGGVCALIWGILFSSALNWGIPSAQDLINSCLAGLVSVTAGANVFHSDSIFIVGGIGALSALALDRLLLKLKIDDVVGAIPVHLGGGIWGTLAVALFADPVLKGNSLGVFEQLKIQCLGIAVCGGIAFFLTYFFGRIIQIFSPLRVKKEDEIIGLNISEHRIKSELFDMLLFMKLQSLEQDYQKKAPEDPFTTVGLIGHMYNQITKGLMDYKEELEEAKKILEHSNERLKEYDYTVAHDLKGPIGGIRTFLELIKKGGNDDQKKDSYYENIGELTSSSMKIIDRYLNYTVSGDIGLRPLDVGVILNRVEDKFKGALEKQGGVIEKNFEEKVILGDEILLEQVLVNILSNSIKYSGYPERKLFIKVQSYIKEGDVFFSFEDNGRGIAPEELKTIFDKGRRSGLNTSIEGQGLGLYTTKHIVENMRGRILVESKIEEGTVITINFPFSKENF
jgi:Amt family ammonium transporter